MIKSYELTYLVSPDLSEEEIKAFSDKIGSFLMKQGGLVENQTTPAKRKLAYAIKKKTEAFLATIIFKIEAKNLENLEKKIKAENQIIRYIIITKEAPKKIKWRAAKPRPELKSIQERETFVGAKKESKKVEIKDIDKKIEEILNE